MMVQKVNIRTKAKDLFVDCYDAIAGLMVCVKGDDCTECPYSIRTTRNVFVNCILIEMEKTVERLGQEDY